MKSEVRSPKFEGSPKSEVRRGKLDGNWDAVSSTVYPPSASEGEDCRFNEGPGGDLEQRTIAFGEAIVRFAKKVPKHAVTNRLIDQLVGAGTSVGANYLEAIDAVSRKDFKNRVGTSRKESRETMYFLRLIAVAEETLASEARVLWKEARELNLIFGSIWRKM